MKSTLDILSARELQLLQKVNSFKGKIEDINKLIIESGIPLEYNRIFEEYSNLNENPEALKRSIFIQWYSVSEPLTYMGILDLEEKIEKQNLKLLAKLIHLKKIDLEFQTMLLHYYRISDWYFNSYLNFEELIQSILSFGNPHNYLDIDYMNDRGQMGLYWNSLNR